MNSPNEDSDDTNAVDLSKVQYLNEYIFKNFQSKVLPSVIHKGYIVYLHEFEKLSIKDIAKFLFDSSSPGVTLNVNALVCLLRRIIKDYLCKKRSGLSLTVNQNRIKSFLADTVNLPEVHSSTTSVSQHSSSPADQFQLVSPHTATTTTPIQSTHANSPTMRSDCPKCRQTRIDMQTVLQETEDRHSTELSALKAKMTHLKKHYCAKHVNQYKKRKTVQLEQKDVIIQSKSAEVEALKSELKTLSDKANHLQEELSNVKTHCSSLTKENSNLIKELKSNRNVIDNLKLEIRNLHQLIASNPEEVVMKSLDSKVDQKQYSLDIRKVVYFFLLHNVPVEVIGPILKYTFSTLACISITYTPSSNTCSQMMRELGLLSDLQCVDAVLSSTSCCISWDATTLSGCHPNEFHISTPSTVVTLNVRNLPGGRAADYASHIKTTLDEVSSLYAEYHHLNKDEILCSIQAKILSTLTDRVAANHATVVLLEDYLGRNLLELNCQLHPLDGLANAARSCLKTLEAEQRLATKSFGTDCQVANVLHLISKLRYKEKGDPRGFKAFLREKGIPVGVFIRYVGNRLHVLFHLAGLVYHHKNLLVEFADSCKNQQMAIALKNDLQQPFIAVELQALGLLGKLVTGPWMALFYTPVAERKHFELSSYIGCAVRSLERLESAADELITMDTDVFGRPLVVDEVLVGLQVTDNLCALSVVLSRLIASFLTVLKKQLHRYLCGDLSQPSEDALSAAEAAPTHNIWAERTLELYDAQHRRAPNATESFLDSKCKASVNKTMLWLDSKAKIDQKALVDFAVQAARKRRNVEATKYTTLHEEILKRIKERRQSKDMSVRRKVGKLLKTAISSGAFPGDTLALANINISEDRSVLIDSLIKSSQNFISKCLHHVWNVDGKDIVYCGRILKFCVKAKSITISYWLDNELEEESVDYKLKFEDFLTDVALGDLLFDI